MRARQAFAAFFAAHLASHLASLARPFLRTRGLSRIAILAAIALAPQAAAAANPPAPSATPAPPSRPPQDKKNHDPLNQTALSEFMETCLEGNVRFLSRDLPGAIELYRRAIALAPRNALGHYFLGEALLASGSPSDAELAWTTAEESTDERNPSMRARVLFVLADVKEREKKWDEAKAAWLAYGEYAQKHEGAGASPQTAISRAQAIDDMLRQDKLYEVVRQRIAAERDGASPSSPATPPAPAASPKK